MSIEPRPAYPALGRSRLLKPIDDQPVWSIVCFLISRSYRRRGVTVALLRAAVDYAFRQGAQIVEGYPIDPPDTRSPDVFVSTGLLSAYLKAGFVEVARRSPSRPVMRHTIEDL